MDYAARTTKGEWAGVIRKKYWENQKQALAMALGYLKDPGTKQAMVRMPTGTGKTGVIATLARLLCDHPRCLVVAPWKSLVQQLKKEIGSGWWEKIGEGNALTRRKCISVTPTVATATLDQLKRGGVILCTHQTLQTICSEPTLYRRLRDWCSLVLVDEGHREPAPAWSRAIRGLERPTLLFTATPYRNDLRLFNVSSNFFYTYTFLEAVDDNVVRTVDFELATWCQTGNRRAADFSDTVISAVKTYSGSVNEDFRVIVRCETEQEVRDVVGELARRNEDVIGIHERFTRADGKLLRKRLPDPMDEPAKYWVHQWKMLEGLDDSRFRLLAIYAPFTNARNLVQQVGRIIRNPDRLPNQHAWVVAHQDHGQDELWDNFCGYEAEVRHRKEAGKSELTIFDDFVQSHLSTPRFYLLGDFRRSLRSNDISDPRQCVRIRKSVIALKPKHRFIWSDFIDSIEKELLGENAIPFGSPHRTDDTYLQLYQLLEQSPVVTEAFMDVGLGYVFVGLRERLIFFSDSAGRRTEYLIKYTNSVDPDVLQRLFPNADTDIGEVSLISGDFGNHVFRRRTLSTKSLDAVPPSLSDYVQVCSTATARIKEPRNGEPELVRRYVGFTRGRLAERTVPVAKFNDFDAWLNKIAKQLRKKNVAGSEALHRFALPTKFSTSATDDYILFDIVSEELDHSAFSPTVAGLAEDKLWRITAGRFFGEIDEKQFQATLRYDETRNRYCIDSQDLERVTIHEPDRPARPLVRSLNDAQSFRVLRSDSSFYTEGKFFKPNALPWRGGGSRLNIVSPVIACPALLGAVSEKGDLTGWTATSVFGAIADPQIVFAAASLQPDTVICYDVTKPTELADFFAVSYASRRVAMIHAKKSKLGSKMSASAFYDVCSQAVRYLGFFNPNDSRSRITAVQLNQTWSPDTTKYQARSRTIINTTGGSTTAEIAARFENAVRDPTFTREVWIVMGNGLSRSAFEKAMNKTNPLANERELALLLQATWSAVAAVGATLRVICPP